MSLARFALRNLHQRVLSTKGSLHKQYMRLNNDNELVARFSTTVSDKGKSEESNEVAVSESGNKSRLFPRRKGRKWLSRNYDSHFVPAPFELFPIGVGNALMQASESINNLFKNMNLTPWSLSGHVKESENDYKLKYEMPGIPKENVKITIGDGVLNIKGEHKEDNDDEHEYLSSYYNTSLVLPNDAKVDEIKAELKDGVLIVTIPRSEKIKKDVKHVNVE